MSEKHNIKIVQKAETMNKVVGYQNVHMTNPKKEWHEKILGKIVIGVVIAVIGGLFLKTIWGKWGGSMKNKENKNFSDIQVQQTSDLLMFQTKGVDLGFNQPENVDLGKINILQQSPLMQNVTGLQMSFGPNAGEVSMRDHVVVKQKSNNGSAKIEFNGHLPGVEIGFNKRTNK